MVASTFATRKTPVVRNNVFGPATIDGKNYPANSDKIGVRATDSGRTDRVNLSNIHVVGNDMNGSESSRAVARLRAGQHNVGSR